MLNLSYKNLVFVLIAFSISCHSTFKQKNTERISNNYKLTLSLGSESHPKTHIKNQDGKVVFILEKGMRILHLTNYFIVIEDEKKGGRLLANNGKELHSFNAAQGSRYSVSKNFAVFKGFKSHLIWNRMGLKIVDYSQPIQIHLHDNFVAFQINGKDGALYNESGHQIMNFKNREELSILISNDVAGFIDPQQTGSFWDERGNHIISFIKEPYLNFLLEEGVLKYKTQPFENYKPIKTN